MSKLGPTKNWDPLGKDQIETKKQSNSPFAVSQFFHSWWDGKWGLEGVNLNDGLWEKPKEPHWKIPGIQIGEFFYERNSNLTRKTEISFRKYHWTDTWDWKEDNAHLKTNFKPKELWNRPSIIPKIYPVGGLMHSAHWIALFWLKRWILRKTCLKEYAIQDPISREKRLLLQNFYWLLIVKKQ